MSSARFSPMPGRVISSSTPAVLRLIFAPPARVSSLLWAEGEGVGAGSARGVSWVRVRSVSTRTGWGAACPRKNQPAAKAAKTAASSRATNSSLEIFIFLYPPPRCVPVRGLL